MVLKFPALKSNGSDSPVRNFLNLDIPQRDCPLFREQYEKCCSVPLLKNAALFHLCKASVGKATNRQSMSHGYYPDFLLFFPTGFLWQVFSGLCSNRTSIVSGCSALVLLLSSFKLALSTCTIFLYFRFSERLSLSNTMCSLIGYSSNVVDTLA